MEKMVNGKMVPLPDEEVARIEAERAEYEAGRLGRWRGNAALSRRNFCLACFRAGLLSADDAVIAAKGEWPASFDKALTGMTADRAAEAKIEWAAVTEIRRDAPLLKAVQVATSVTDGQIDALFGWDG